jgi:hypothetical protein
MVWLDAKRVDHQTIRQPASTEGVGDRTHPGVRLWSVEPGVTRDNRGSLRTLIQQLMGRLARSTDGRCVAYNDEDAGSSPVTPTACRLNKSSSRSSQSSL